MSPREFTNDEIRRSRIKAGMLFAIAIVPLLLATLMYYTGWGLPSSTTNNGEFVGSEARVLGLGLRDEEGRSFATRLMPENDEAKWWILISADQCGQACQNWLDLTQRVHQSLHRDADSVRRGFISNDDTIPDTEKHARLVLLRDAGGGNPLLRHARNRETTTVFVADPMGNLVLRYDGRHDGTDLLEDIEHLLDASPLG